MDACDTGIGAVLSQQDNEGRERVIAYGSHVVSEAERRYCMMQQELIAVVTFTRQYHPYLMGRRFLLSIDHGSLTWLHNFPESEVQLAEWLEKLEELDFDIGHRQGKKHTNADTLSRIPRSQCNRDCRNKSKPECLVPQNAVAASRLQPPADP